MTISTNPAAAVDDHTTLSAAVKPYNPYQDLTSPIPKIYYLPTSLEHLYPHEASKPYRAWGSNLQTFTGTCFLAGGVARILHGGSQGVKAAGAGAGESVKVVMSRVLSSGVEVGRRYSNHMGLVGLYFSVIESGIDAYRGKDGILNSCLAGFGAGGVYKAARGVRAAAIAGVIGGGAAVSGKKAVKDYVGEVRLWGF